jgi:Icc-related predicted phosphoesterase
MNVYALSDQHGDLPEIPECDLLLIAGDICPDFLAGRPGGLMDKGEQRQRNWLDNDFRAWLDEIPAKNVVGIAGNHDFVFEHKFLIPEGLRWHYLEDDEVEIGGLRIWGTPWVPKLQSWAFYGSPNMLSVRAEAIPSGIDILLSHGPPFGYGDGIPASLWIDGEIRQGLEHAGEDELFKNLDRIAPKVVVCGHIHEGYGSYKRGDIDIYNVSVKDALYDMVNPLTRVM